MNLSDVTRRAAPLPWAEGDNIPWNDPDFSRRMLREHLTQEHDAATRRLETVDRHVRFIHEQVLEGRPGRILDLACGPGLYTHRLAKLGHSVHGIDFAPASIDYARRIAAEQGLDCAYTLADLRVAVYPGENDLVMLIFGEFNVFRPADARDILRKARAALKPGGRLLLEPHRPAAIRRIGSEPARWSAEEQGLFSDRPHLLLTEAFWDEPAQAATTRFYRIDAASAEVTCYAASYQCYDQPGYTALLAECGFHSVRFYPSLTGAEAEGRLENELWAVVAG